MSKAKGRKKTRSSRGASKKPKRIVEGRRHKTKRAPLRCSQCGRYFETLGQINEHYSAVGHKRRVRPPKKVKMSKDYTQEDVEKIEALILLMKDPVRFREIVREAIIRKARRSEIARRY